MSSLGLTLWLAGGPQEVVAENLGPIRGRVKIGEITGPGLWFFVGPNGGGKSTFIRTLLELQDQKALAARASELIHLGEAYAKIIFGPTSVTFLRTSATTASASALGLAALPAVQEPPVSILSFLEAADRKSPEVRARRRLKGLLGHLRQPLRQEGVNRMLQVLDNRPWSGEVPASVEAAWVKYSPAGADFPKPPTKADFSKLVEAFQGEQGLLLAQEALDAALKKAGLQGEKVVAECDRQFLQAQGAVETLLKGALEKFQVTSAIAVSLLESAPVVGEEARREEFRALQTARAVRRAKEEERAKLTPPEKQTGEEKVALAAALAEQDSAQRAKGAAEFSLAEAKGFFDSEIGSLEQLRRSGNLAAQGFFALPPEAVSEEASAPLLEAVVSYDARCTAVVTAKDRFAKAQAALSEAEGKLANANSAFEEASRRNAAAEAREAAWMKYEEERSRPLAGPTEEEFKTAEDEFAAFSRQCEIASAAAAYKDATAKLGEALQLAEQVKKFAQAYRKASAESWEFMGLALTETLNIPWLAVEGLDLFVGYDVETGMLNMDPEIVKKAAAEAQVVAEKAVGPAGLDGGVSLARFILETRRKKAVRLVWKNLDEQAQISDGELAEATLRILLENSGDLGGIVAIPWEVLAALDGRKLRGIHEEARRRNVVLLSERPERAGDEEKEIHLESFELESFDGGKTWQKP